MSLDARSLPATDPTPIFEIFRGSYGAELLTAAVSHFRVFDLLNEHPKSWDQLRRELALEKRPAHVLVTALLAFGLLRREPDDRLALTPQAREHLISDAPFGVGDYLGLAAASPGVQEMIARLVSNRPAGANDEKAGAAFIFRDGIESAMEHESSARHFTLALAGRAKNVAPALAARVSLDGVGRLIDVGGGTGIYSIAFLQRHPNLRACVVDRPEVLKVAAEMAAAYGVADRLELFAGDMFSDPSPEAGEVILLSNVLHDWDVPQCRQLVTRWAETLPPGGRLLIHDVFLDDALDGPLPIALYSASLFCFTEGRAYSGAEYRRWLEEAGLTPGPIEPTLIHCGVLTGRRAE